MVLHALDAAAVGYKNVDKCHDADQGISCVYTVTITSGAAILKVACSDKQLVILQQLTHWTFSETQQCYYQNVPYDPIKRMNTHTFSFVHLLRKLYAFVYLRWAQGSRRRKQRVSFFLFYT